jgi:WD40 repeat protein
MLMNAELLITFQMTDWVACTSFHPGGGFVAAGSADSTISLWDLTNPETTPSVYREHTQPIWSIDFNDTGDFMVSASMDHSLKLWDCATARCRGSFRGHVDSVNSCKFQPYANCFISGSGDKTVSLWDMRTNQCVQTLYGHLNSINSVSFNLKADTVASCDADGVVKVWDLRMVQEKYPQLDTGRFPATSTAFDKSGTVLLVGSEDGNIYAYSLDSQETIQTFKGHEQGVQDLVFDPAFKYFVSAGGDCTFRVWS